MSRVVTMTQGSFEDIAILRRVAKDLTDEIRYAQRVLARAMGKVDRAQSSDALIIAYTSWLGKWHSQNLALSVDMLFRGLFLPCEAHALAHSSIKRSVSKIEAVLADRALWISVPNAKIMRQRVHNNMIGVERALEDALGACAVLSGQPIQKAVAA